jgi:hypothetical protein
MNMPVELSNKNGGPVMKKRLDAAGQMRLLRSTILFTSLAAAAGASAQASDLERIKRQAEAQFYAEKTEAVMMARRHNLPIRFRDPKSGVVREIMKLGSNGRPVYFETRNVNAAKSIRANLLYPGQGPGFNRTGSQFRVGLWDAGVARTTHQEFGGRVTDRDAVTVDDHATHAAGTIMASGVGTFTVNGTPRPGGAKGVAYGAIQLFSYDWNNMISELASAYVGGSFISVSNHPYGPTTGWANGDFGAGPGWYWFGDPVESAVEDGAFGRYDSDVAAFDALMRTNSNFRAVWAVGNDQKEGPSSQPAGFYWNGSAWTANPVARSKDGGANGYDTISGNALCKNVLSIGAVADAQNYSGPGSVTLASFSSIGPTDDGRIKPDLVASGMDTWSPSAGSDTSYMGMSGTSSASSAATGALMLGFRGPSNDQQMEKAVFIHTARECGPSPGPDYKFGWGLIDCYEAAWFLETCRVSDQIHMVESDTLDAGETKTYPVTIDGDVPVRLTLCWSDPAGSPINSGVNNRTKSLVHDLDIRLVKVAGPGASVTYLPWTLDPLNPENPAVPGDNTSDNVEVIDVPAGVPGLYEIRLTSKGTIANNQRFVLLSRGIDILPLGLGITTYGTYITGTNSTNARVQTVGLNAPGGGTKIYATVVPEGAVKVTNPIVVPPGQALMTFPVVGGGDVNVNTPFTVKLHCGYGTGKFSGILVPLRINSLELTPNPVQAGQSVTVTIKMNGPAPGGGKTLTLDRSPTYWVMAPPTVTIPQGQSQITFQVPIRAGAPAISNARITAIQNILPTGSVSLSKLFNITP